MAEQIHSRTLSREERLKNEDEAGFLTLGSQPGFSPSPSYFNEWRATLDASAGRRSRLSEYSGGTVWDSHPLPFYPRSGAPQSECKDQAISNNQYHRPHAAVTNKIPASPICVSSRHSVRDPVKGRSPLKSPCARMLFQIQDSRFEINLESRIRGAAGDLRQRQTRTRFSLSAQ